MLNSSLSMCKAVTHGLPYRNMFTELLIDQRGLKPVLMFKPYSDYRNEQIDQRGLKPVFKVIC